jgi:hypothetical protein
MLAPSAGALATTPPPTGDDPELATLLLTVADLPPGWNPFAMPAPPTADPGADLGDPCNALLHRFDLAYVAPHALAAFTSGQFGVLAHVVFRLDSPEAASDLVEAHIGDAAACPVLTGADGLTTSFTALPLPELGDVSAASRGEWALGGIVLFHSAVAVGDTVITVDISGQGGDPALLEELTTIAVERAGGAAPGAGAPDEGAATSDAPAGKPDLTIPSG